MKEPLQVRQCLLNVLFLPLALVNLPLGPIKLLTVRRQLIHVLFVPVQVHGLTDVCFGHPVFLSCDSFQRYSELFSLRGNGLGTGVLGHRDSSPSVSIPEVPENSLADEISKLANLLEQA